MIIIKLRQLYPSFDVGHYSKLTTFTMAAKQGMVDPAIFAQLQQKIDEESTFRDVSEVAVT
jgi:hypothetical protein